MWHDVEKGLDCNIKYEIRNNMLNDIKAKRIWSKSKKVIFWFGKNATLENGEKQEYSPSAYFHLYANLGNFNSYIGSPCINSTFHVNEWSTKLLEIEITEMLLILSFK